MAGRDFDSRERTQDNRARTGGGIRGGEALAPMQPTQVAPVGPLPPHYVWMSKPCFLSSRCSRNYPPHERLPLVRAHVTSPSHNRSTAQIPRPEILAIFLLASREHQQHHISPDSHSHEPTQWRSTRRVSRPRLSPCRGHFHFANDDAQRLVLSASTARGTHNENNPDEDSREPTQDPNSAAGTVPRSVRSSSV